ncbi:hypothetical protein PHYBLDRAFT_63303 [Phycomyces blakesleeanus NRRL 1555(-)]|uniref:DDE Tnp4 domain-containing protein n=1 Tax=Phycomyces blakesleeanus (strain ATCC 8743b / DSM 1359 / FGSC 10004 / NBRC 33097 / NRRL 1555) TaxID=763407 RepID=A0A162TI72_PHYB8|nr:hypothetical protein PHYBLDRAFT_63303 [Phycomyces blakesleeanus NRRL 1555(-)]OAD68792.1 hypothetical protein PHYBLDRAFT_63303 [Phycomyces blakesleeanus NRRL 1555(-)]|eukprot:XP_018286832.1 hypothetical protein PHYBLDRAFT_63303 [Phycomyces blakesleeanus NRRL 1555(-)]
MNPVFNNTAERQQVDISIQMMVALKCLEIYGTGVTAGSIAQTIGQQCRTGMTQENVDFNTVHSNICVSVEHCIRILKERFQSLKGLKTVIHTKKDIRKMCY